MLSKTQKENLVKLADFLDAHYNELKFNMFSYGNYYPSDNICGTVACAAGHGPMAGIRARESEVWYDYIHRVFIGDENSSSIYTFLFSQKWVVYDNTPNGAAARIRYFLDHEDDFPKNGKFLWFSFTKIDYSAYLK